MKRIISLVSTAVLAVFLFCAPALSALKAVRISDIGIETNRISEDMVDIEDAMVEFAATHPNAIVDSFQIVKHSQLGTYDLFIFYRE